jgi:ribosomal protein S18 acetylase RimI-like enzyme
MDHFKITKVTKNDCEALHAIAVTTFTETYSPFNTEENMRDYLTNDYALEQLTREVNNPNSEFYFAVLDQRVIGFLKLNFAEAQTELKDATSVEIERIYVLNEFQGQKIGQLLFEKALGITKKRGCQYLWLCVWENNPKAIRFYQKNGLTPCDKHIFKFGNEEQIDIMMKIERQ